MTLRTFAEFTCDLPTGQIESDAGFIRLGGQPVAQALSEMLQGLGCRVDAVQDAGDHGWEFSFRYEKLRHLWCQVTLIEGYLVIIKDRSARWRIFAGDHACFVDVMRGLGDALAADPSFHDVGWFHEDEILSELRGARHPDGVFSDAPCIRFQAVEDASTEDQAVEPE